MLELSSICLNVEAALQAGGRTFENRRGISGRAMRSQAESRVPSANQRPESQLARYKQQGKTICPPTGAHKLSRESLHTVERLDL